jgi:RNA polymerase sigma-70 factor (ECF subfamily)
MVRTRCQPNAVARRIVLVAVALDERRPEQAGRAPSGVDPRLWVPAVSIDLTFEEAFDDLYARAYGVGYQLLGSRAEAEDVAQETLARAYVRWRKIRDYAEAWVVRVAANLAIDSWRRTRHLAQGARQQADPTSPAPDGQRVDLHRALAGLSKRQREVIVLRFLADLPEAAVARALGCSPGAVKQHASRGLAALRVTLGVTEEQ